MSKRPPLKESKKPKRSFFAEKDDKSSIHSRPHFLRHPYQLRGVPKYIDPFRFFDYQRIFNFAIIKHIPKLLKNPHLLIPDAEYKNIQQIPFKTLHRRGFQAIIFDKDNTLSLPLEYPIHGDDLRKYLITNKLPGLFRNNLAILSNSLGNLRDNFDDTYDIPELMSMFPEFNWWKLEEVQISQIMERRQEIRQNWRYQYSKTGRKVRLYHGIPVIIHNRPKPDCFQEIMDHFKDITKLKRLVPGEIVFIGDRILTDVVLGNMHGMYTILIDPLDPSKENFAVRFSRRVERMLYNMVINFHKLNSPHTRTKWENYKTELKYSLDLTLYRIKRLFFPRSPAYTPTKEPPMMETFTKTFDATKGTSGNYHVISYAMKTAEEIERDEKEKNEREGKKILLNIKKKIQEKTERREERKKKLLESKKASDKRARLR